MPKTKLKKPLAWLYPIGIQRQYQRVLVNTVREWEQLAKDTIIIILPSIVNSANSLKNPIATDIITDNLDDWVSDVNDMMEQYDIALIGLTPLLPRIIQQTGENVSNFNNAQWKKIIKHSLGIDYFNQEPWLNAHLEAFTTENVSLIKKLQDTVSEDIRETIVRGVNQGKRHETISKEILNGTDLQKGVFKKAKTRAKLIGRDQVSKLNGQLQQLRQTDLGITKYVWRTSEDERVRASHRAMNSKSCSWHNTSIYFNDAGERRQRSSIGGVEANPGQPIQCITGDSIINNGFACKKLFRRFYRGIMARIVTDSSKPLTLTLNHPILTNRGFLPFNKINIGDYIINIACDESLSGLHNIDKRNASISEIFDFFNLFTMLMRDSGGSSQFHNDGVENEEVNIIDIDSFLPDIFNTNFSNEIFERFFIIANSTFKNFSSLGNVDKMVNALFPAPSEVISGFCHFLAFINIASAESEDIFLRDIPNFDTLLSQSVGNGDSTHIKFFRDLLDTNKINGVKSRNLIYRQLFSIMSRLSASYLVDVKSSVSNFLADIVSINPKKFTRILKSAAIPHKFYKVIDKSLIDFSSHVYNLETFNNYYNINDAYTIHNCRCNASPDFSSIKDLDLLI
ncbi:MAG: phage minor head protein [Saprospiraceae bacterium]